MLYIFLSNEPVCMAINRKQAKTVQSNSKISTYTLRKKVQKLSLGLYLFKR